MKKGGKDNLIDALEWRNEIKSFERREECKG